MAKPVISSPHSALFKRIAWLLLLLLGWQQAMAITMQQTALAKGCPQPAHRHHTTDNTVYGMPSAQFLSADEDHHQHSFFCEQCITCYQTPLSDNQQLDSMFVQASTLKLDTSEFIPLAPTISLYRPPKTR